MGAVIYENENIQHDDSSCHRLDKKVLFDIPHTIVSVRRCYIDVVVPSSRSRRCDMDVTMSSRRSRRCFMDIIMSSSRSRRCYMDIIMSSSRTRRSQKNVIMSSSRLPRCYLNASLLSSWLGRCFLIHHDDLACNKQTVFTVDSGLSEFAWERPFSSDQTEADLSKIIKYRLFFG